MSRALQVLASGPLTLIQDLGRPGLAALGVGRSGAADRGAFRLGARLLAQDYTSAGLEVTFGGLAVRANGDLMVALTGAEAPVTIEERQVATRSPLSLRDGETLRIGTPTAGLRTYLSVRGGVDVPAVLGSRATDTLSGIGPPPVKVGDRLPVGPPPRTFPVVDHAPAPATTAGALVLHALPGPRDDWLAATDALTAATWTVSSRSDRVGIRLEGPALQRRLMHEGQERPSEGVVRGAIQVPAGGEPVLFLADHPVTGGYPVVAVVREDDVDAAAQAVPGHPVRIVLVDPED